GECVREDTFIGHGVPRRFEGRAVSTIIHTLARTGRNENGPPSGPRIEALAERAGRAGRSIGTSMQHGLVGLIQIRKVDGLVLARLEDDVAQHLATTRALAFDMDHEGGALALLAQDRAQAEHRIDVARRDRHVRYAGVRTIWPTGLIFRIGADEREVV